MGCFYSVINLIYELMGTVNVSVFVNMSWLVALNKIKDKWGDYVHGCSKCNTILFK